MAPWIAPDAPPAVVQTINRWQTANDLCRDAPGRDEADSKRAAVLCRRRDHITNQLKADGWCYGEGVEVMADATWKRCRSAGHPVRTPAQSDALGYDPGLASKRQYDATMQRVREAVEGNRISAANMCVKVSVMRALSGGAQSRRGIAEAVADHCARLYGYTESFAGKFARPTALSKAYDEIREQAPAGQR